MSPIRGSPKISKKELFPPPLSSNGREESETKATMTMTMTMTTTLYLASSSSSSSSSSHHGHCRFKSRSKAMKGQPPFLMSVRKKNCGIRHAPQRPRTSSCSRDLDATWKNESEDEPDVVIVRSKKSGKKIVFSTRRRLDVKEISRLCDKVGWPKRPEEKLKIAFENSYLVAQMYICLLYTSPSPRD